MGQLFLPGCFFLLDCCLLLEARVWVAQAVLISSLVEDFWVFWGVCSSKCNAAISLCRGSTKPGLSLNAPGVVPCSAWGVSLMPPSLPLSQLPQWELRMFPSQDPSCMACWGQGCTNKSVAQDCTFKAGVVGTLLYISFLPSQLERNTQLVVLIAH